MYKPYRLLSSLKLIGIIGVIDIIFTDISNNYFKFCLMFLGSVVVVGS